MRARFQRLGLAAFVLCATVAPVGAQTVAITGGKVFPVSGPPIENGTVLIRDGKIVAVGVDVAIPSGARRIDATGKWVTPGLINSSTTLGVVEIGAVAGTRDNAARGRDNIAAAFQVWDGLNPASVLFPPAREEGVTNAVLLPQGGLVAGQAAIITLLEGTVSDMVLRAPVAMVGEVGDAQSAGVSSRGEVLMRLRELLEDSRIYARRRGDFERAQTRPFAASRLDLEAMQPVLDGRLPLLVAVDRASDIDATLALAKEFGIKVMIGSGAEAWQVADRLAAAKVPVLTGAMNNIPGSFSSLGSRQENAALLRAAGVQVAIIGDAGGGSADSFNAQNVKYEAGNAVAYGMSWDDALRAITLTPAELFGVSARIGSLQAGRDANVVVWSGDPFEFATRAEHVLIRGKELETKSRQELLIERYRTLPPAYTTPTTPKP